MSQIGGEGGGMLKNFDFNSPKMTVNAFINSKRNGSVLLVVYWECLDQFIHEFSRPELMR